MKTHIDGRKAAPYFFLLPFLVFFLIFRLWPIVWSFLISFFELEDGSIASFIGLSNYATIFKDPTFIKSIWNTIYFVIVYNVIMIFLAILLAVFCNSPIICCRKAYRAVFFSPIAMSLPVVAVVFDLIFARNIGFITSLLGIFGVEYNYRIFASMTGAMWAVILMRVWRGAGSYCAYFLAGLTSIPEELYESAMIDGANSFQQFWKITLPLLKPMLVFVIIMSTILSFQLFDEPWILTQGGPANSTLTLQMYLYQTSFLKQDFSKGAAVSYVMTLLMLAASVVSVSRQKDSASGRR